MSTLSFDHIFADEQAEAGVAGDWFCAQWIPDIGSGERLNIGVGLVTKCGEFELKMLEDFSRLACLYDTDGAAFHAELACRMVREVVHHDKLKRGRVFPNLILDDRGFAQGSDIGSLVDRLFAETVTLARPRRAKQKKPFQSVSREQAYTKIYNRLKSSIDLEFERHVPNNPFRKVSDQYGTSELYLPFERKKGTATLVSAAYADPYRAKCNLYDGFRSVDTALRSDLARDGALFVIMPGDGLNKTQQDAIDDAFDEFYSLVQRHKIEVQSEHDLDALGDRVAEWCLAG